MPSAPPVFATYNECGGIEEALVGGVAEVISFYNMFTPGMPVGVAVSGGADSVCLLHVLVELAPRWNLALKVFHLDHMLRGEESRRDSEFTEALAASLGLPFQCHSVDVAAHSGNLEQAARMARRRFFLDAISSGTVARVALGHTRDDQAETVLYRFLRGSGTAGLAGMRPVTRDGLVRPLIQVSRSEVEQFLRDRRIGWREDSSNRDLGFRRNRIRHSLLPALSSEWNPSLAETLAGVARVAADEEDYWHDEVRRLAGEVLVCEEDAVILNTARLAAVPRAPARRVLRYAMQLVKGDLRSIDLRHVEAILALALRSEGHGRVLAPGVDAIRSFDWIRLAPAGRYPRPEFSIRVTAPGRYEFPRGVIEIEGKVNEPLELRNWRPGDAYAPAGSPAPRKIKEMFQEFRVPLWKRVGWPVLLAADRVIWAAEFGPSAQCFPEVGCRMGLSRTAQSKSSNPPPCL